MPTAQRPLKPGEPFWRTAAGCTLLLAALCGSVYVIDFVDPSGASAASWFVKKLHRPKPTQQQLDNEMAGYYEGIFQVGRRTNAAHQLFGGQWEWTWSSWRPIKTQLGRRASQRLRDRDDYLCYELKPYLNIPEFDGRCVTNSHCMADQEYSLTPQPNTWRVALIGDSLTRGLGADFGHNYEALLEAELNARYTSERTARYEILNFACEGYRLTQFVDVVREVTPKFQPNAYIVALTVISTNRLWADHICQLLIDGVDLKYPYLRSLVEKCDLRPADDMLTVEQKLGPYREECLRWGVREMRDFARSRNAELLVLLVPQVVESEVARRNFAGVDQIVRELDVPLIDLLDAYDGIDDLAPYRVSDVNRHANNRGQEVLFEKLLSRLKQDPRAWPVVTGRQD
jgi:hypothetical protein